ncbi:hypothetical protein EJB05_48144, partial [Eragrostis curvula]
MEMSKQSRSEGSEVQTTLVDSALVKFKVDYEEITTHLREVVHSYIFSAGGHMWRITCRSFTVNGPAKCGLCTIVEHLSKSRCSKAIVEAFLMDKEGNPSTSGKQTDLVENYIIDGQITIICSIMVLSDSSIPVPPSDMGKHLGHLLDNTVGTYVSFNIGGKTFHAHRAVLTARSPVFRAELLGSMAEATMPAITLQDPCDPHSLDRLKLTCAQKLCDGLSVDTVAVTLACAQMYNCPELKNKCMDFFAKEENFKKAVLTKSFFQLGLQFPSVIDEIWERDGL